MMKEENEVLWIEFYVSSILKPVGNAPTYGLNMSMAAIKFLNLPWMHPNFNGTLLQISSHSSRGLMAQAFSSLQHPHHIKLMNTLQRSRATNQSWIWMDYQIWFRYHRHKTIWSFWFSWNLRWDLIQCLDEDWYVDA
jgi:hypothetical protein